MGAENRIGRPLRRHASLLLMLLCLGLPSSSAQAQNGGARNARVVLGPVPAELKDLAVQIVASVAPKLVVTNPTDQPLDVLDSRGVPFISIGPQGVSGNVDSPSWYRTNDPAGRGPVPEDVRTLDGLGTRIKPRWVKVTPQRSWGWFDSRLRARSNAGASTDLGTWNVPVRYRGKKLELSGRIVDQPVRGRFEYSLDGKQQVEESGMRVSIRPGRLGDIPILDATWSGADLVVMDGAEDEPFLALRPGAAVVNKLSPTWLEILRVTSQTPPELKVDPDAPVEPVRVGNGPQFEWPELRALYGQAEPPENVIRAGRPVDVLQWWLMFSTYDTNGHQKVVFGLPGVTRWVPVKSPQAKKGLSGVIIVVGGLGVLAATCATLLRVRRHRRQQDQPSGDSRLAPQGIVAVPTARLERS